MENAMLVGDIDVLKIDKGLFRSVPGKKYMDIVLIPTPNSKYGSSHMVVQGLPKERRDAGDRGEILGNVKIVGGADSQPPSEPDKAPTFAEDEEIPF